MPDYRERKAPARNGIRASHPAPDGAGESTIALDDVRRQLRHDDGGYADIKPYFAAANDINRDVELVHPLQR